MEATAANAVVHNPRSSMRKRLRKVGPFWQPLSPEEREREEAATRDFLALLGDGEYDAALRAFRIFAPPGGGSRSAAGIFLAVNGRPAAGS